MAIISARPLLVHRISRMLEKDPERAGTRIEEFMQDVSARLMDLDALRRDIGHAPRHVIAADTGILPGMYVHVTGETAFKAVNTDESKYATAIVTDVGRRRITVYGIGEWPAYCLPFQHPQNKWLFLSNQPGFAQDFRPETEGQYSQLVGIKRAWQRDSNARCVVQVKWEELIS